MTDLNASIDLFRLHKSLASSRVSISIMTMLWQKAKGENVWYNFCFNVIQTNNNLFRILAMKKKICEENMFQLAQFWRERKVRIMRNDVAILPDAINCIKIDLIIDN